MKKVLLIAVNILLLLNTSCDKDRNKPKMQTNAIQNIGYTKVLAGGSVTATGKSDLFSRGICWSTHKGATKNNNYIEEPTNLASFQMQITGLEPGTKYYINAYGENNEGIGYGEEQSITTKKIPTPTCTPVANSMIYNGQTITFTSVTSNEYGAVFGDYAIVGDGSAGNIILEFNEEPVSGGYTNVNRSSTYKEFECSVRGKFGTIWSSTVYYTVTGNTVYITKVAKDKYNVTFCNMKFISTFDNFTSDGNISNF